MLNFGKVGQSFSTTCRLHSSTLVSSSEGSQCQVKCRSPTSLPDLYIKCTTGMLCPPFSAWRNWYLCFASFGQCSFPCIGSSDRDSLMIFSIRSSTCRSNDGIKIQLPLSVQVLQMSVFSCYALTEYMHTLTPSLLAVPLQVSNSSSDHVSNSY